MGCEPFRFCGYSFRQKHRVCFTIQYKSPHDLIEITHQKRRLYVRIACKWRPKTIVLVPPQPCKPINRNSQRHCFPYPFFILSPPDKRNTAGLFLPTQHKIMTEILACFHVIAQRVYSTSVQIKFSSAFLEFKYRLNKNFP